MVAETLRDRNHRLLILYLSCMNLGVYLSAPFFSTFMLRPSAPMDNGLGWSYVTYMAVNGIAMVFKFLFLPLWGRASDRFGTRKCLTLSAALIASLPLFWLTPREHPALYLTVVCLTQALGGFAWAGHELCSFNFLLDAACARDRPRLVASMNIVNGLMIFLGSSAGALLVSAFSAWGGWNPFLAVFLASALTRSLVCLTFLPRLREVRQVESISYRSLLFRVTGVRVGVGPVMRFFLLPLKHPPAAVPATAPSRMVPVGETEPEESCTR
jgi:MFS family permease